MITHTVSGGDYEDVTVANVEVTITEDDTPGVSVSVTALTITEGDSQSYAVVLDTEPAADVTVDIQGPDDADSSGRSNRIGLHGGQLEYATDSSRNRKLTTTMLSPTSRWS